jgi:hypothetical protein
MNYGKSIRCSVPAALLMLTGCGGGGAPSTLVNNNGANPAPTATPVTVIGRIDGFGSVFVDGIEFETTSASYRVDDNDGSSDRDLSVGMIVRVSGSMDDSSHGRADRIDYDDDVEGIVAGLAVDPDGTTKTFTIFSTPVVANSVTTVFRGEDGRPYTFDDIADGDHIEVSGDFDGDTLVASFIKLEDDNDDDFEVKGEVSAFDGTMFTLTLRSGATLTVMLAANAQIPASGIEDGQRVEVEGTIPDAVNAPDTLLATRVEVEDRHDFDDRDGDRHGDELRIEGPLNQDGDTWSVRDTLLQFSTATEYQPSSLEAAIADGSADGLRVKVRGKAVDGVDGTLLVERISTDGGDDLEVKGIFESSETDANTGISSVVVSFPPADGTVTLLVGPDTLIKHDDSDDRLKLSALAPGMSFVEAHGHLNDDGDFVATVFEHEDDQDEYEIEGPLDTDGFVDGVSITVLGVTFQLDPNTQFEDGTPRNGDIVDVEDQNRDAVADGVDRED